MRQITFTVIIACYNAEQHIEQALLSVIHQKDESVELIVVDGKSSDGTMNIVNRYKDDINVIISEPDQGVYDAWNKAIARSHGQWIMFLGADDYYKNGIFNIYSQFMEENSVEDIDLISAKCQLINDSGKVLRVFGAPYKWTEFRNKNRLSHGSALHNRHLFKEVGLFSMNYKISADYELLLRKKMRTLFLDKVVIAMRAGGMSYSAKGLTQTFMVKRFRHSSYLIFDIYYLIKGLTGFYLRKLYWYFAK